MVKRGTKNPVQSVAWYEVVHTQIPLVHHLVLPSHCCRFHHARQHGEGREELGLLLFVSSSSESARETGTSSVSEVSGHLAEFGSLVLIDPQNQCWPPMVAAFFNRFFPSVYLHIHFLCITEWRWREKWFSAFLHSYYCPEQPFALEAKVSIISFVLRLFTILWRYEVLQGCLREMESLCKKCRQTSSCSFFFCCLQELTCKSSDFHPCWSQSNRNISALLASRRVAGPHWWHLYQIGRECCRKTHFSEAWLLPRERREKCYAERN